MSSNAQITANQTNAQASTGPTTPEGKAASARNSFKHGLTCLIMNVTAEEHVAYQTHVSSYLDHHNPTSYYHRQLVLQLADSDWAIHQVFVQQANAMALMNAINLKMTEAADPVATAAAIAPVARMLNTLSIYENRRRRAAKAVAAELAELQQTQLEQTPKPNQTRAEPEIGFVCSNPVSESHLPTMAEWAQSANALLAQLEAEVGPVEAAAIRAEAAKMDRR
jgi:hypothetical protein